MSPRKNNRPAAPSKDQLRAVSDELTKFVHSNVRDPEAALASMKSIKNDAAPEPEHVTHEDLIGQGRRNTRSEFDQDPSTVREVNGPDYLGPKAFLSHSRAGSPAPAVSTRHPASTPFTHAGTGQKVIYFPIGVDLPPGSGPVVS